MSDPKKYNVYDFPLHEVTSESIRLSENERKKYNQNLEKVLESIINQMKTDETFKCLFRNRGYTGSSYENLKISKPNEFDINLIFVWPEDACQVIYDSKQPGFVKLKLNLENPALKKKRDEAPSFDKQIKKWIDKNGFLIRGKFKSWMQGRVTKVLEAISVEGTKIKQSASGPAITLLIQQPQEDLQYSVDLVPSFLFTEKDWPKPPVRGLPSSTKCKEWCVVPKEPNLPEQEPVYWRMTFSTQEKELINDRGSVKHVIKLIKLLRDKENWINDLYSYAIKTVFLWECETLHPDFWKQGIGFLFVHMLQKLVDVYLSDGKIMYYWDKKLNIIGKMKDTTRNHIKARILVILKELNSNTGNPYSIKKYFGCVPVKILQNPSDSNSCSTLIDLDVPDSSTLSNSFSVSPPQDLVENEIKPEKGKVKVDVRCTVECNEKCGRDITVDNDSTSAFELLKTLILKENQEMKETLQSILSQLSELNKEVKIVRQENALLKEQLQHRASISTTPSNEIEENLLSFRDLRISHSSDSQTYSDISQPSAIQQNSMTDSNENLSQVTIVTRSEDLFSHLLPDNFGKL